MQDIEPKLTCTEVNTLVMTRTQVAATLTSDSPTGGPTRY